MEIPVLVEPTAGGFRAAAAPLGLEGVGPTPDDAVSDLRARVAERVAAGAHVRTVSVPDPPPAPTAYDPENPAMTPGRFAAAMEAARRLRANPLFGEYVQAVEEYRRKTNIVPDPDDPSTHWPAPPPGLTIALYLLDTTTFTLYQHGHPRVVANLAAHAADTVGVTTVTGEEALAGWHTRLRQARTNADRAAAAGLFADALSTLRHFPIFPPAETAFDRYDALVRLRLNVGGKDL